jgi:ABC-type sugar transport system permease subunit
MFCISRSRFAYGLDLVRKSESLNVRKRIIILFLLPAVLLYAVFFLLPTFQALRYSFFAWSGFGEEKVFVGLANYKELLHDQLFWLSMKNTMLILVVGGIAIFTLALIMTIALNSGIKGRKLFRSLIFLPNIIATIALTTIWAYLYNPSFGLFKAIGNLLGFGKLAKLNLTTPDKVFWSVLVAIIWMEVGYYLVLLMAGVDKIPKEYYEAAQIEGANSFQTFFKITVPMIWDVLSIAIVLFSIGALKIFEFPYAFYGQSVPAQLYTVGIYLYIMGFGKRYPIYRLGYATAIGVMLLLAVIVIIVILRAVLKRDIVEY